MPGRRRSRRTRIGQLGFTLAELMVAIAVGAIIMGGSMAILYRMVTVSADHRDETMAVLQVQFVGFWISEDVVQAQKVLTLDELRKLGDKNKDVHGFLTATWTEWDGDENEVRYTVSNMENEDLWRLTRTHSVNGESAGNATIAEYLDSKMTYCEKTYDDERETLVMVEVFARVDENEASATYEIFPRALE